MDLEITNGNGTQVNSASGNVISWTNFISAYVIGSNSLVVVPYTYNNLIYCRFKNMETMDNASNGNYTLRVWYKAN